MKIMAIRQIFNNPKIIPLFKSLVKLFISQSGNIAFNQANISFFGGIFVLPI